MPLAQTGQEAGPTGLNDGAGTGHDDMALALAGWWAYENRSLALSGPELKALD